MATRGAGIQVVGARRLRSDLKRAGVDIGTLKAAHKAIGQMIAARSMPKAPVVTGRLKSTVRAAGQSGAAVVRAGYASVPYANPIHWGWPARNIEAQPWLWDTVTDEQETVIGLYERAIQAILDQVEGG